MDFSTPTGVVSTHDDCQTTMKIDSRIDETMASYDDNRSCSTIINDNNHETMIQMLVDTFRQHQEHFHQTQISLELFDRHLHELNIVLKRLQQLLNNRSTLSVTVEQLETRLLQMFNKREQIRSTVDQSPSIIETINDMLHQVRNVT
jgi:septum formation inhibitor MinC